MHPSEFLKVAEYLCNVRGPASLRTAVNRSYYASFLTARNYAEKILNKKILHGSKDHTLVKKYLAAAPDIEISELADDLGELQGYRRTADYEMDDKSPENLTKVEELYLMAENIVKIISDHTVQSSP